MILRLCKTEQPESNLRGLAILSTGSDACKSL